MPEMLDIVDENGIPTGRSVPRTVAHAEGLRHRTSHVWIVRKKNGAVQVLLQMRCAAKDSYPGCYDISSAGHIPAGAEFVGSALRELKEELGVTAAPADLHECGLRRFRFESVFHGKPFKDNQVSKVFCLWLDKEAEDFTVQRSEIDYVKWFDLDEAIRAVEAIGAKYGIGRDMHIGDTIIGIKGRVGFEAAAPMLIIAAHRMLEKHTQTKWQIYWKEQVANWYGMFLHEAQYLEPVMRDIEAMLASSQRNVTGTVELILRPYSYTLVGVDSTFDLMKTDFGEYGEVNKAWTADDVKGFTKILGNQIKIYHNVQKRNKK